MKTSKPSSSPSRALPSFWAVLENVLQNAGERLWESTLAAPAWERCIPQTLLMRTTWRKEVLIDSCVIQQEQLRSTTWSSVLWNQLCRATRSSHKTSTWRRSSTPLTTSKVSDDDQHPTRTSDLYSKQWGEVHLLFVEVMQSNAPLTYTQTQNLMSESMDLMKRSGTTS